MAIDLIIVSFLAYTMHIDMPALLFRYSSTAQPRFYASITPILVEPLTALEP